MADLTTTAQLQNLLDRLAKGDPTAKADLIDRAYERLIIVGASSSTASCACAPRKKPRAS